MRNGKIKTISFNISKISWRCKKEMLRNLRDFKREIKRQFRVPSQPRDYRKFIFSADISLLQTVCDSTKEEAARTLLHNEMEIAKNIQISLLFSESGVRHVREGFNFASLLYRPAHVSPWKRTLEASFIYLACVRSSLFGSPLNRACKWILIPEHMTWVEGICRRQCCWKWSK